MRCLLFVLLLAVSCLAQKSSKTIDWAKLKPKNVKVPLLSGGSGVVPNIVGGRVATRGQFPYQAALFMDSTSFCGGSLVSTSLVLTAAHCTAGHRSIAVYLGAHMLQENFEANRVILSSVNHTAHPQYSPTNRYVDFDIAVIRLPLAVTLTPYVNIVRLPAVQTSYPTFENNRARVSGWGLIADGTTSISNTLNFVDVSVITNTLCRRSFGLAINPDKLCVATTGGLSPCNGDSGGPLVIQEADRSFTQIGVVSFGSSRGCSVGAPSVFTRVTSYLTTFLNKYM